MVMSIRLPVRPGLRPSVTVFRNFLLHALICWAEILHVTFFLWTFDEVRVSSIFVGVMSLLELKILTGNTLFSPVFSYMLWHIGLKFCICLYFTVLQIKFECRLFLSIFVGVMPLLGLRILEIQSFMHFSPTWFDILSWNCAYDFILLYYIPSLSVVNLHQFLKELCPFWTLENRIL